MPVHHWEDIFLVPYHYRQLTSQRIFPSNAVKRRPKLLSHLLAILLGKKNKTYRNRKKKTFLEKIFSQERHWQTIKITQCWGVFTLASFSFWTSSCIFFFSFSNSVIIRTWFILVSSKACKCDRVGFILLMFRSLPCYTKAKGDARDKKKMGDGGGRVEAQIPPLLVFRPQLSFCVPIFNAFHPS